MKTKRFDLRTVLSVSTERLLTKRKGPRDNGISDMYELLGWMTGEAPFTHQLPRFGDECKPWLLRWFPSLNTASDMLPALDDLLTTYATDGEHACETWVKSLVNAGLPEHFDVPQIPADDHERKNPIDELIAMRGTDEGIEVVEVQP
jgi:hypothetical protein